MASRRGTSPSRWVVAIFVTLIVHGVVGALAIFYGLLSMFDQHPRVDNAVAQLPQQASADQTGDDRPIEIQNLVDELKSPDAPTEAEKIAEEEKKKEEERRDLNGEVVDIARPPLEERPDDKAKFLAEYDSKVEHETRGKVGRDRAGATMEIAGAAEEHQPTPPAPPSGNPTARPGLPGRAPSLRLRQQPGTRGEDGDQDEVSTDGEMRRPGARGEQAIPEIGGGNQGLPGTRGVPHPNLQPTQDMLTRAIGKGAGSPDYLHDVDDGESTALNAKKFKYASFFNRVKRAVAEEWHPDIVYLRHDPSGNVYGAKDRVTVLRVHLKPDGQLQSATMMQSSGVEFLDDEAIDAFRRAQPFVNPPGQLVDADGLIHFNFGFVFELSGHPSFKVYKYQ
jgi:TonB family protein